MVYDNLNTLYLVFIVIRRPFLLSVKLCCFCSIVLFLMWDYAFAREYYLR